MATVFVPLGFISVDQILISRSVDPVFTVPLSIYNFLPNLSVANESQRNAFLSQEIKNLRKKLARAKADQAFWSFKRVLLEQRWAQLEQRFAVQDEQLHHNQVVTEALRRETRKLRREADLTIERLKARGLDSIITNPLRRLIPLRSTDLESTAPVCHICDFQYDEKRTPKVLKCGHTVCVECAGRLADRSTIVCPYDKVRTELSNGVHRLSTNFALIEIMEDWKNRKKESANI